MGTDSAESSSFKNGFFSAAFVFSRGSVYLTSEAVEVKSSSNVSLRLIVAKLGMSL